MSITVKNNVKWIGYVDWELEKFHGSEYSINHGSTQNAYLIQEKRTVLIDTVWTPHQGEFIEDLRTEVKLDQIEFVVANHGEIDHAGALGALMTLIPNATIICTEACVKSLEGQYGQRGWKFHTVKTGDTLDLGNGKKLIFVEMKMLHWPDSMATYMTDDNILFSNDAFGQHYALAELFNDKADPCVLKHEAMKYYTNILNPFSPLVKKKIQEIKAMGLSIDIIAPSHGVIWRQNPMQIVELYEKWSRDYQEDQITVVYDTMWEGSAKIAFAIAREVIGQSRHTRVRVFNISKSDKNEVMTEVFKSRAIAIGSPTVGNRILSSVAGWLELATQLKFRNKKAAAFGCYGWSGEGVKFLQDSLEKAGFEVIEENVSCHWNPTEKDFAKIPQLVTKLLE